MANIAVFWPNFKHPILMVTPSLLSVMILPYSAMLRRLMYVRVVLHHHLHL
jgi:hypothetical protein